MLRPVEEKKKKKDKDSSEELYDLTDVPLTAGAQNDTLNTFLLHCQSKVWGRQDFFYVFETSIQFTLLVSLLNTSTNLNKQKTTY